MMAEERPVPSVLTDAKGVGFWAQVTNNTHYDVNVGFIQEIDIDHSADYTNGLCRSVSGTDGLDREFGAQEYFYGNRPERIDRGQSGLIPPSSSRFGTFLL